MKIFEWGKSYGFPIFLFFMLGASPVVAQNMDVGIGIGGLSYTGDLYKQYRILENRPAGTIFYRRTFSNALSVRGGITGGKLQASDNNPVDDFANLRNTGFDIFLLEAAITLEYHFLDFLDAKSWTNYSPYFFAGVGGFTFFGDENRGHSYSKFQPAIPFGLRMKFLLDERWQLGVEFGARKTFFDYLDNTSEFHPQLSKQNQNFQFGNQYDQDWYYFLGVTLSYTFYTIPCPYSPN